MSPFRSRTSALLFIVLGALGCSSPKPEYASCVVAVGNSPTRGPADAWVTIVEFADFQCSYCGIAESTIADVDQRREGLRWVFKHFPLTNAHPNALAAAQAADCAGQQGQFWEMHDRLFAHQSMLDDASIANDAVELGLDLEAWNSCRASDESYQRIVADFALGADIGVDGTPTFFVNGTVLPGAVPTSDFLQAIDSASAEAQASGVEAGSYYAKIEGRGCSASDPRR